MKPETRLFLAAKEMARHKKRVILFLISSFCAFLICTSLSVLQSASVKSAQDLARYLGGSWEIRWNPNYQKDAEGVQIIGMDVQELTDDNQQIHLVSDFSFLPDCIRQLGQGDLPQFENEVLISPWYSKRFQLQPGDSFTVSIHGKPQELRVSGISQGNEILYRNTIYGKGMPQKTDGFISYYGHMDGTRSLNELRKNPMLSFNEEWLSASGIQKGPRDWAWIQLFAVLLLLFASGDYLFLRSISKSEEPWILSLQKLGCAPDDLRRLQRLAWFWLPGFFLTGTLAVFLAGIYLVQFQVSFSIKPVIWEVFLCWCFQMAALVLSYVCSGYFRIRDFRARPAPAQFKKTEHKARKKKKEKESRSLFSRAAEVLVLSVCLLTLFCGAAYVRLWFLQYESYLTDTVDVRAFGSFFPQNGDEFARRLASLEEILSGQEHTLTIHSNGQAKTGDQSWPIRVNGNLNSGKAACACKVDALSFVPVLRNAEDPISAKELPSVLLETKDSEDCPENAAPEVIVSLALFREWLDQYPESGFTADISVSSLTESQTRNIIADLEKLSDGIHDDFLVQDHRKVRLELKNKALFGLTLTAISAAAILMAAQSVVYRTLKMQAASLEPEFFCLWKLGASKKMLRQWFIRHNIGFLFLSILIGCLIGLALPEKAPLLLNILLAGLFAGVCLAALYRASRTILKSR